MTTPCTDPKRRQLLLLDDREDNGDPFKWLGKPGGVAWPQTTRAPILHNPSRSLYKVSDTGHGQFKIFTSKTDPVISTRTIYLKF